MLFSLTVIKIFLFNSCIIQFMDHQSLNFLWWAYCFPFFCFILIHLHIIIIHLIDSTQIRAKKV